MVCRHLQQTSYGSLQVGLYVISPIFGVIICLDAIVLFPQINGSRFAKEFVFFQVREGYYSFPPNKKRFVFFHSKHSPRQNLIWYTDELNTMFPISLSVATSAFHLTVTHPHRLSRWWRTEFHSSVRRYLLGVSQNMAGWSPYRRDDARRLIIILRW